MGIVGGWDLLVKVTVDTRGQPKGSLLRCYPPCSFETGSVTEIWSVLLWLI